MGIYVDEKNYFRWENHKPDVPFDDGLWLVFIFYGFIFGIISYGLTCLGISFESQMSFIGWIISCVWWLVCWIVWIIFHPHTILAYLAFSKVFWIVLGSIAVSVWFGTVTYLIAKQFCD